MWTTGNSPIYPAFSQCRFQGLLMRELPTRALSIIQERAEELSGMETINLQRSDEKLPYVHETVVVDCYLSSYENPEYLTWNGPSILSPRTHPEDVFRYASAMLSYPVDWLEMHLAVVHKCTFNWVAIPPFFLPRVECNLGNLRRLPNQIWEELRPYMRTIDHANYRFQMFVWPRAEREPDTRGRLGVLSGSNTIDLERILDPVRLVENISCGF
ncbi:hypothetical protein BDQ94DRAFT_164392 [Aspergillus welwitschiae]|uniref:Uncharacterized protein n=1 Tax=Aspergillus welwitschiae TaxID=1341132 RepID=A0A3F3PHW7_9EURO|nr:hypothetical protein BDQ94DRAFT_164392 [Aspergillus welwitschiae]RDH26551.1 hypothetical protein BDQ94DRAFT_164392 [Aspergillus welwitschiae]